jgi:hypothetical protein
MSAMAGALSGVTLKARSPSGTNRITLFGCAMATCAVKTTPVKTASDVVVERM